MLQPPIFRSTLASPPPGPSPVLQALRHAAAEPDRPAVVDGATGTRLSRAELAERSAALAAELTERGVGRGDLVAVAMPNTAWWPVVAAGIWRAGAAVVPLGPRWTADETRRVLARVRPRLAVAAGPAVALVRDALEAVGVAPEVVAPGHVERATSLERLLEGGGDPFAEPRLAPGDLAVVPFSSGTGGLPKGVRLTHGNLAASSAQVAASLGFDAGTVALAAVPFSHVMGLGLSLCVPLRVGAPIVTLPVPDSGRVLELIAAHRVTHATVPLPVFTELAGDQRVDAHDTSSLELLATAGAHVPAAVELAASRRLGTLARQGYGMTEATTMVSGPAGLGRPGEPGTVGWLAAAPRAAWSTPAPAGTSPPDSPASSGSAGPRSWRATTTIRRPPPPRSPPTAGCGPATWWPSATTASSSSWTGSRSCSRSAAPRSHRPSWSWCCASTRRSATPPSSDGPTPGKARSRSPTSSSPGRPLPRS
jgi:acyl-CoA synthetase (AMP-forming)/AMP-acid ligase II